MREAGELDAYAALRSRNYRLLLTGHLLSHVGLQMLSVVVSWDLYLQTKSPIVLGNVAPDAVGPATAGFLPAVGSAAGFTRVFLAAAACLTVVRKIEREEKVAVGELKAA